MNKIKLMDRRDSEFLLLDEKQIMVIACDSCGGIGLKKSDVLKVSNEMVGSLTARVPILEILSLGVDIKMISLTIINEVSPTANEIIDGVKLEFPNDSVKYVISTEKNMETSMTGLGVTAMGMIDKDKLRLCKEKKYRLFIAGIPSVADEVLENLDSIFNQNMLNELLMDSNVLEIIPCGSSGIIGELSKLEEFDKTPYINSEILKKSCGPATAALVLSTYDISKKHKFLIKIEDFI